MDNMENIPTPTLTEYRDSLARIIARDVVAGTPRDSLLVIRFMQADSILDNRMREGVHV